MEIAIPASLRLRRPSQRFLRPESHRGQPTFPLTDREVSLSGNSPIFLGQIRVELDPPEIVEKIYVLVGLYQAVIESAVCERLARIYMMRLAAENARRLVDGLTLEYNMARRNAITAALLEVAAGYEATAGERAPDAGPTART